MKHFFYKKKSRWLLLAILAMMVGASPTWADEYTCGFEAEDGWAHERNSSWVYTITSCQEGWGLIADGRNLQISTTKHGGTNSLYTSTSNTVGYVVSPKLAAGTISLYGKRGDGSGYIAIYKADENDGVFETVGEPIAKFTKTEMTNTSSWFELSVDLDEDSRVAILLNYANVDDFTASNGLATGGVAKPKNFTVSNITGSSADFSWTAGSTETDWELSYSTTSGVPDNGTIIPLTETSYSLTGLTAETTYYASVRAKVGEEYSAWSKELSFTPSNAVKLTVNDGTSTNSYIPIYGNYVDYYDKVEFVIPASDLADMTNSDIKAIQFYMSTVASASWGNANFKIYMKEVDYTTISSFVFTEDDTPLYNGAIDGTKADMALTLSTPYHYNGGNLLVGVYNTVKGTYKSASFYGVSANSGASVYGTNSSSLASITSVNKQSFLPKTTFTYLPVDGPVMKVSESSFDFGTITKESTAEDKTKTFTISNTGTATLEGITVSYSGDNAFSTSPEISAQSIAVGGDAITVTVTMAAETPGDYSGTITVSATDQTPVEIAVSGTYAANPATMSITLGEEAVGSTVAFGNVGKQATKTFTITNTGNLKLNITSIVSSNTTDFTVSPATLEVAGGSSETFTVTFLYDENARDEEKTATITVTPSNDGIDPVVFTVTGTRIEQWSEDFSGNALPEGWETTSTTYWTFADGVAKGSYQSTNYYLTTPSLTVEEGASLSFDVCANTTYVTMTIEKQLNNGSWTSCKDISYSSDFGSIGTGAWKTFTIDGLETGNYKFRFNARGFWLDNFQGFKRNMNDPKLGIYSDSECTATVATSITKDFGFATETQTATYYIKNDGTGTMTLSLGDAPDGITQTLDKTSVTAGDKATLTITMPAENKGYNGGNVVVTATDLGTFTVAVSGVIIDENKLYLDFATDNIPTTWINSNFTKNSTDISTGYNGGTLQTATLTAEANEQVVVRAKQEYTSSSYTFGVNYRKVGDEEWSELIAPANIGTNYVTLAGTITEAGNYELQFTGKYVHISNIYGLAEAQEPVMAVYDGESLAGASYNYGNVSNENDATWTLTVKNEGKAKLTGLAAALSGTNAAHYSVEISGATGEGNDEIEANAQATITVKQLKDNLGSHEATLTISADDPIADKVIALSGTTRDHTKLYLDFEDGNFPATWTNAATNTWIINTQQGNKYLRQYRTATSAILTSALTIADDEVLKFDAKSEYSDATLTVRYTTNGGITWTDYATYTYNNGLTGTFDTKTISGIPAGTVMLQFDGMDVGIDNVYGFAPTTAPMLSLTESAVAVANESTKEFGNLTEAGTATYTLSNTGTANLVSTVATTGVATAAISGEGEGVTISENTVTLAPGKSATITLTLPYEAPYGEKAGAMTISSEGWVGDMVVNYTATTVDPTALYVDFNNNTKPEGWYQEASGWIISTGRAHVYTGLEKSLVTEQYAAEEGKNVLRFDAKLQSNYAAGELKIYTSTDRKTWTLAKTVTLTSEDQQVALDALANGSYYVKFESTNASIDNLTGLKTIQPAPEHDLYVSASNIPTATKLPESSITATATVYSLRANEEGVYAKLFFNEELVATAEAQDINKDGSVNFELTGNVPATEKTYAAKIVVYYSDNSVAFETLTTNVEVAHTRTLAITAFTRDGEGAMEADEQNQISPVFNVTVQNNGTTNYESPTVKVFNGEVEVGTATSNATVAPGESAELTVTATNMSAGEGGELSFTAKAYWDAAEFSYATPVVIEVTAAAPKFALYQDATPVNNGDDVEFGLTRIAKTYSYTIKNEGTAPMELVSIVAPTGFTATAVTNENKDIAVNGTLDIDVTLNAEQGKKSGNLVITYKVDANTNNTFTLALSGRSISEDTWVETFDTEIPASWTNNGWEWNSDRKAAYSTYTKGKELMTPRLAAEKDEELTFDVIFPYNNEQLKVQYSTDKTNWTEVATYNSTASNQTFEGSFIAPATGNYYLKFGDSNSRYVYIDNFVGFKLNIPEHDTEIASSSVPTTGKQYNTYTATVTLKENAGKAEEVTAKLYVGGEVKATKNETITANGSTIVTLTWEPEAVISEAVKAYVAVTGTGIDLTTDQVDLTIAKVYTLDETSAEAITAVSEETILLKRTFAKGWNTVCLPFNIGNVEEFFGEGAKAYSFTSYIDGTLGFTATATISQTTPYVVYVPTAINEDMKLNGYSISSLYTEADVVQQGEGYFRGTYAPIAAPGMEGLWGVTTEAKIAKGTDKASMKGFRAYFELPNGVSSARLAFTDEDGTTTVIKAIELDKQNGEIYNLNGQRVENMKKGNLYIINGKKQIRR